MTAPAPPAPSPAGDRAPWRAVTIPTEHGGWGLTLEPVLLGLIVAFSLPGLALGLAAMVAFLARTPMKVALVDRRRHRSLPRTRLAAGIAVGELLIVLALGIVAVVGAGWQWMAPIAIALPLIGVELWFDVRSRSRRLVPELCGAIGIAAVAPAIVIAGDGTGALAAGVWLILTARAVASIPFVRIQIARLRHGPGSTAACDAFQTGATVIGVAAALVDRQLAAGAVAIAALAAAHASWARRSVPPVKVLGIRQMALGLAVVAATAAGVLLT